MKIDIGADTAIWWMRRDIRIHDNAALYHALKENEKVIPLFIFDTEILNALEDPSDRRVEFIHGALTMVKDQLESMDSSLLVLHGNPVDIFRQLKPKAVYTNHDYESYALKRDKVVGDILGSRNIPFNTYKDHVIFEKNEVLKSDGTPYTVFTPYSKQWKARLNSFYTKSYPCEKFLGSLKKIEPLPMPSLEHLGFRSSGAPFPERVIKKSIIRTYDATRNFPAIEGTTKLGVHLRFGTVSIRDLVRIAQAQNETWLNELIWREFFSQILWHFPYVEKGAFRPVYDRIEWINNEKEFEQWCAGKTGYPMVDAGMRELNETGFMHNRTRMVTASFLTKHLLIDWRWGEAYFAKKLLDFDLASNNGGWQWAAGCGCDAAPYFRVFNPTLQADRFDPDQQYIRKWLPEFGTDAYPPPMVDHIMARDRVVKVYQHALQEKD